MIDPEVISEPTGPSTRPAIGYGNFTAGAAPTVDDDITQGYSINSHWYKATYPYGIWVCTDNTEGAAVWRQLALASQVGPEMLFVFIGDAGSTVAGDDLFRGTMPAAVFDNDKVVVEFNYSGYFNDNTNDVTFSLLLDAVEIFNTGSVVCSFGGNWQIDGYLIRSDSDELRCCIRFTATGGTLSDELVINYNYVSTPWDFDAAIDLTLYAISAAADDAIAQSGWARRNAAPVAFEPDEEAETFYLTDEIGNQLTAETVTTYLTTE